MSSGSCLLSRISFLQHYFRLFCYIHSISKQICLHNNHYKTTTLPWPYTPRQLPSHFSDTFTKNFKKVRSTFPLSFAPILSSAMLQISSDPVSLHNSPYQGYQWWTFRKPKCTELTGLFSRIQHGWSFRLWTFSSLAFPWFHTYLVCPYLLSPCLILLLLYQILECSGVLVLILSILFLDKLLESHGFNILSICR